MAEPVSYSKETLLEMYRRMVRIRSFEDTANMLAEKGEIPGAIHTSQGQEGEIVGSCMALRDDDYIVGNHRSHGHPIGKGAELKGLMAEMLGKNTGVCRGKGGSMHLADFKVGSLGETSIVGSGLPVAVGAGLGAQMLGQDRVALCFFGDGASNQGTFHEGLNLAAIWKLPVIFLCENNLYAQTTSVRYSTSVENIADRAKSYNIPGVVADGQDVLAVHEVVSAAVSRAREGAGPSLVEAKTYRYLDHAANFGRDLKYRPNEEIEAWRQRDPVALFRQKLLDQGNADVATLDTVDAAVRDEVDAALEFARVSPYPQPGDAYLHLFSNPISISN